MKIAFADIKVKAAGTEDGLEEGQFTGYASVFGNVDSYGDVVQKGAFKDTLNEWKESGNQLPVLWGHDMGDPFSNIGGVIEAKEDDHGLLVTAQLDLENPKAKQVYRLIKGRRINQMSFAFEVLEGGPAKSEELGDFYSLDKLKLYEVSIVPLGANQETEIVAVKHAAQSLIDGLKAGRVLSAKNESALRAAHEQLAAAAKSIADVLDALPSGEEDGKATAPLAGKDEAREGKSEDPQVDATAALSALELELML